MDDLYTHGYIVQNSVIPLHLGTSKDYVPIFFIDTLKEYEKNGESYVLNANVEKFTVIYWDYFDNDRQDFENSLFKEFEKDYFKISSKSEITKYLTLCKTMNRCSDEEEGLRIFKLIMNFLLEQKNNNSDILVSLLETVGITNEAVSTIFTEKDYTKYLEFIYQNLVTAKQDPLGLWLGSSTCPTDLSLISMQLYNGNYSSVILAIKYGLQWKYSESVLIDYCKQLNPLWSVDLPINLDPTNEVTFDRFCIILQTFYAIWDWKYYGKQESLEAILTVWKSVPYPFVTPQEMSLQLQNFTLPSAEITHQQISNICEVYSELFCNEQPLMPRSLQDLCRCTVRNRLSENFKLPCGVSELNLPSIVHSFIKLDD